MSELQHKLISVGRKTVAFGLEWFAVEGDDSPQKAAQALAKQAGETLDIAVIRKGEYQQFGLVSSHLGAKPGSISAAAMAAEMMGHESWLYVMELGGDIWVAAGRDGYIIPDGDRVYPNAVQARAAVKQLNPSTFKRVFMPASWRTDGEGLFGRGSTGDITPSDYQDFLHYDTPAWAKLKKLSGSNVAVQALLGLAILGAIGFGAMKFLGSGSDIDPDAIRAQRDALLAAQQRQELQLKAELDSNRPWTAAPLAQSFVQTCIDRIQKMPLKPVGYDVRSVSCSNGSVDAEAVRTSGYTNWLIEWAGNYPGLEAGTDTTGSNGYITAAFPAMAARGDYMVREDYQSLSSSILEVAQIEGAGVTLAQPTAQLLEDYPDYVPAYASAPIEISTTRPNIWIDTLKKHDGVAILGVSFNLDTKTYIMEGTIYVPNY